MQENKTQKLITVERINYKFDFTLSFAFKMLLQILNIKPNSPLQSQGRARVFIEVLGYIYLFFSRPLGSTLQLLGKAAQGDPQPCRAAEVLHVTRPVPKTCPFKTHSSLAPVSWPDLTSTLPTAAWSGHSPLHHHLCAAACPPLLLPLLLSPWGKAVLSVMLTSDSRPRSCNSYSFPMPTGGFGGGMQGGTSLLCRPGKISNGHIFCVMTSLGGLTNIWYLNSICSTVLTKPSPCAFAAICQWKTTGALHHGLSQPPMKFKVTGLLWLCKATLQMSAILHWRATISLPASSNSSWRFPSFHWLVSYLF